MPTSRCALSPPAATCKTDEERQKLDYHSTECIYSPTAYRGHARALVKDLEAVRPSAIVDIVRCGSSEGVRLLIDSFFSCRFILARRWQPL